MLICFISLAVSLNPDGLQEQPEKGGCASVIVVVVARRAQVPLAYNSCTNCSSYPTLLQTTLAYGKTAAACHLSCFSLSLFGTNCSVCWWTRKLVDGHRHLSMNVVWDGAYFKCGSGEQNSIDGACHKTSCCIPSSLLHKYVTDQWFFSLSKTMHTYYEIYILITINLLPSQVLLLPLTSLSKKK
jgi:hypothetical protein